MANQRREQVNAPTLPLERPDVARGGGVTSGAGGGSIGNVADRGDGSAELYGTTAKVFRDMADRVGRFADEAAVEEGKQEGALAGFDPEFRPRGDLTLFSRAYDQAAVHTYRSQMSVQVSSQLEEAFDKHKDNPAAFNKAAGELKKGWLGKIDLSLAPHVLPDFEATFSRLSLGYNRQATRNQLEQQKQTQVAALNEDLAQRLKLVDQQAFRLGLDETADAALAGELTSLRQRIGQRGADGRFLIAPDMQASVLRKAEQQIATSRLIGAFSRLDDPAAQQSFIDGIKDRYRGGQDKLLNTFDVADYEKLVSHLYTEGRRRTLGAEQSTREIASEISAMQRLAADGIEFDGDRTRRVQALMATGGKPEHYEAMQRATATLASVRAWNVMPPEQLEAQLTGERTRLRDKGAAASEWEHERLRLGEAYLERQRGELAKNQLGWAQRAGVARVQPLDLSSPEALSKSLAARVPAAEHVAGHFRREPQYLMPEERTQLGAQIAEGGAKAVRAFAAITTAAPERAPQIMKELGETKAASVATMLGGLYARTGATSAVLDAADGIALSRQEGYKALGEKNPQKLDRMAREAAGALTRDLPQNALAAQRLAGFIYERRARHFSYDGLDTAAWSQALREAYGETVGRDGDKRGGIVAYGPGWFGRREVIVPPEVRQDRFGALVQSLRPADLGNTPSGWPVDSTGKAVTLELFRRAHLVSVGDGRYKMAIGNPDEPGTRFFQTPSQRDYVLDLNPLLPALKRARPDFF